jgi:hypothetical protein
VITGHNEEISEEITASLYEEKHEMYDASKNKDKIHVRKACLLKSSLKHNDGKMSKRVLAMIAVTKTFEFARTKNMYLLKRTRCVVLILGCTHRLGVCGTSSLVRDMPLT